jgi:hypothetical protein
MGSFATEADDVRFPKKMRKKYPILRTTKIECKKRRELDIVALFAEAVTKYGENGKNNIVLATKRPVGQFQKKKAKLRKRIESRYSVGGPVWKRRIKQLKQTEKKISRKMLKKIEKRLRKDFYKALKWETALLRAKMSNTGLITVTLEFFSQLWWAWLRGQES